VKNIEQFRAEISILQQLDHPHILKLYEYFEDAKNFYVITELCTGGELFDKIIEKEAFTEKEAAHCFKQILQGINYCHSQGIVHRDLKPENFLYETKDADSDMKIIDFGLSKVFRPGKGGISKMQTKAGTPYYISPEVLAGNYDEKCDLWAAGCILYTLLCGYPAFCGDDDQEILQLVIKGKYDFDGEEWEDISKEAKDLIKKLIAKPERRLSAQEALDHKWIRHFTKGDENKLAKIKNVSGLKKTQHYTKMQQAAMTAIAVQAGPDDIRNLKEIFLAIDVNGDGSLSFQEIEDGLKKLKLSNYEDLLACLKEADVDNSGSVDYTEFIAATLDSQVYMKEEYLKVAFDMFDKDGSGSIDNMEVVDLLNGEELKGLASKEAIAKALKEIDANGDGEIDFEEFKAMMKACNV
jgi:calcium-dependent protein kinase